MSIDHIVYAASEPVAQTQLREHALAAGWQVAFFDGSYEDLDELAPDGDLASCGDIIGWRASAFDRGLFEDLVRANDIARVKHLIEEGTIGWCSLACGEFSAIDEYGDDEEIDEEWEDLADYIRTCTYEYNVYGSSWHNEVSHDLRSALQWSLWILTRGYMEDANFNQRLYETDPHRDQPVVPS